MEEFDRMFGQTAQPDSFEQMFGGGAASPPVGGIRKPRSGLGEIATGVRSGVTEEVPLQAGQAMQWLGEPTGGGFRQGIYDAGKSIADAAKARQALPENQLDPTKHGAIVNALAEGGKMLAPSVVAPALVGGGLMLAGAAAPELAVGAGAGAIISAVAGSLPAAMQQGQQTYENVKATGASDEAARTAGWKNLAIEGAGETIGTYTGEKFLGLAGKTLGKALAPGMAGAIEGATNKEIWKPFAKNLVGTALTEVATEIGQAGGEAAVEKAAGVDTDPIQQMKDVVGPTLGMTALLAPFGLHANYRNAQNAQKVDTYLADPASATPEQRLAVVDALHEQAKENKIPDADQWLAGAKEDIAAGLPIRRTAETTPEQPKVDEVTSTIQQETLNQATPDEVKIDKVEGDKATVTAAGRTVEIPVEEAAKAVASGKLEEVLAGKEALPVVEELPFRPTAPTSTNLKVGDEVWSYLPPAGKTVEDVASATANMSPAEKLSWFKENNATSFRNKIAEEEVKAAAQQQGENQNATLQSGQDQVAPAVSQQEGTGVLNPTEGNIGASPVLEGQGNQNTAGQVLPTGVTNETQTLPPGGGIQGSQTAAPVSPSSPGSVAPVVSPSVQLSDGNGAVKPTLFSKVQPKQSAAGWTPERTKAEIDYAAYDDGRTKAVVGFINPNDFVAATVDAPFKARKIRKEAGSLDVNRLKEETQSMYLRVNDAGEILDHEGRHRMAALAAEGVTSVPVILDYGAGKIRRSADIIKLAGQKFDYGVGQDVNVTNVTPLTFGNADNIKSMMSGGNPLFSQGEAKGGSTFVAQVQKELKGFLGRGYDNLVRRGKLEVVKGIDALPPALKSAALKMVAWHGTPHEVDKFSSDKIGTGEGAQAYGHGLYFAGNREVAEFYRKNLSRYTEADADAAIQYLKDKGVSKNPEEDWGYRNKSDYVVLAATHGFEPTSGQGRLYQVDLKPKEDEYLLWDKPLSEQSEKVKAALKQGGISVLPDNDPRFLGGMSNRPDGAFQASDTGKDLYQAFTKGHGDAQEASNELHSLGIRGIKYLDGTSRSRPLKDIKKAFLAELPEDATFEDVLDLVGTGKFSAEQDRIITALDKDDWLGFDYPAQAISAALGKDLTNYDPSPELVSAISELSKDATHNYVIFNDNDIEIKAIFAKDGKTVGAYFPALKKVVLFSDSMAPGQAEEVMRHEAVHALLNEDKVFREKKTAILKDFAILAKNNPKIKEAFTKVPTDTATGYRGEEALAYFLQEPSNRKHSIFTRVISAIKAALYRLGLAHGRLSESDLVALFTQGTKAWSQREQDQDLTKGRGVNDILAKLDQPGPLFSKVSDNLKAGQQTLKTAVSAMADPKSKLHDLYVQYAPQWLSVTPLNTLVQTFGKTIPQIRSFSKNLDAVVAGKTEIVDTSAVLYEQAETLAKAGVGVDVLNRAAATSSFNRMTPWEGLLDQEWVPDGLIIQDRLKAAEKAWSKAGMRKATGKSFSEAYYEARDAYSALKSAELKSAYQKVVDHIASVRTRERNNLLTYIEQVSEEGSEARTELMNKFNASFSNLYGAYWPLARVGDFVLEYIDSEGFRQSQHFTTIAERNEAKANALAEGVAPETIKEDYKNKQPAGAVAIPQQLLDQLNTSVKAKYLADINQNDPDAVASALDRAQDTINDMTQIWLRWQPETSALKNSIKRKNVKGFSEDMLRSYLSYMQRHASSIAWSEQGRKIELDIKSLNDELAEEKKAEGAVDITMKRHILNDLRNRIQALRSVSVGPVASLLGKMGTAWYMTSPSIALVQMSQLGVLTFPKLSTMFGLGKATKALASGTRDAFNRKFTREPMFADQKVNEVYSNLRAVVTDENRNTTQAQGKGLGDRLYTEQEVLAQVKGLSPDQVKLLVLRESMARNLLDISAAHEAYELTRGKDPKNLRSKIFNLAMMPMSLSELASRKATVLATLELAQGQGKDFFAAMNDIGEVVNDTLYSYAKENKGSALQGGLSRVLLQFQHYRIMTGIRLALLLRNTIKGETPEVRKAATKEFVGIMGMTGALAGTVGIPMSSALFGIMSMLLGDDDEPYDAELAFNNWLKENFGETATGAITKGLPTLAGADLSRRLGMGDLYGSQAEPPSNLHGRELAAWWAANQLGPTFSVGQGFVQGYDEMFNKGNFMKGLEAATPKPIKDALKALRVSSEGLKTGAGKKLLGDEQIGPDDIVMMALGFNPAEIAKAQSAEHSLVKLGTQLSERRGRLISDAAKAIVESDDTTDALAAIRTFNSKLPMFAVTGRDITPAVRRLVLGDLGTTGLQQRKIATQFGVPTYAAGR